MDSVDSTRKHMHPVPHQRASERSNLRNGTDLIYEESCEQDEQPSHQQADHGCSALQAADAARSRQYNAVPVHVGWQRGKQNSWTGQSLATRLSATVCLRRSPPSKRTGGHNTPAR